MATQSLFSFLDSFLQNFQLPFAPPNWLVEESHRRIVLLINHVLVQEPQATQRLTRQKGNVVLVRWQQWTFKVVITPAGLFDLAAGAAGPDLTLVMTDTTPVAMVQAVVGGGKPNVRVEGDVQLAAEINWLIDHVRWDLEEDLAKLMGDAPAHTLAQAVRSSVQALKQFAQPQAAKTAVGPDA